ncbi:MAG: signal peptidase I [Acidimicrobiales bacterium]
MKRLLLAGETLVVGGAVAVASVAWAQHWHAPWLYAVLAASMAGGVVPSVLATWAPAANPPVAEPGGDEAHRGTVTVLVKVGDEPPEVTRASIASISREVPIVIVSGPTSVRDPIRDLGVPVYQAESLEAAIGEAAADVTTDAVFVVSGRVIADVERCERAAGFLSDDIGWVTGTVAVLNGDGFVAEHGAAVGRRFRAAVRARGVDLWESDATLVRTDLLVRAPLEAGRPWGRWLRSQRAAGRHGIALTDETLAYRVAPVSAHAYWPDTTARQRAAAADVGDAATAGRLGCRLAALALLSTELVAWRALAVGVVLVRLGASPYEGWRVGLAPTALVLAVVGLLRWAAVRRLLGVGLHPVADLTWTLHRAPGSLAALVPALTRRRGAGRLPLPTRPLVWAALLLTVVTGAGLIDQTSAGSASTLSVVSSLGLLAMLWGVGVGAFLRRNWERSEFRVPLDLLVEFPEVDVRSVDASPDGLSIQLSGIEPPVEVGREVDATIHLDDGAVVTVVATIVGERRVGDDRIVGFRLDTRPEDLDDWMRQLLRAATRQRAERAETITAVDAPHAPAPRPLFVRWTDRVAVVGGVLVSVAVLATLTLVMSGYHTLVIRSGSMRPTLGIGDVVISQTVRASELRPGDVVTVARAEAQDGSLTHRVRSVDHEDGRLVVTTRGDANRFSESVVLGRDDLVGRESMSIPRIGTIAILVRSTSTTVVLTSGALLLLAPALARSAARTRASRRGRRHAGAAVPVV